MSYMKQAKNIMKYKLYMNASNKLMIIGCDIDDLFGLKIYFFYDSNLYGRYVLRYESFLTIFSL